jgi:hypothetical protein
LTQLPLLPLKGSADANEALIGTLLTSLAGGATLDVFGHKRTWVLDWVCLTQEETAAAHAWFQGLTTAPLRVVDPRAGNWLTRDGASGGSYHRDTRAHTLTSGSGSVTFAAVSGYPSALQAMLNGGITWTVPGATTATMLIDSTDLIPLIPGQAITAQVWLTGTGTAQVGAQFYDVSGAAAGSALGPVTALGGWAAVSSGAFTPTGTQVAASLMVVAASGSARAVTVGPATWHPTNTDWVPGTGCPQVLVIDRKITYPGLANQDTGITLREV